MAQQALRGVDKAWSYALGVKTDKEAQAFLLQNNAKLFVVKNEQEFKDGSTDGEHELSSLSRSQYNNLNEFYSLNVKVITSTNPEGTRRLGNEFKKDVEANIDALGEDISNLHIPNGVEVEKWIKATSKNLPDMPGKIIDGIVNSVHGTGNYIDALAPTSNSRRLNELYGQGEAGSRTQANIATTDVLSTMSMVTGVGGLIRSGVSVPRGGMVDNIARDAKGNQLLLPAPVKDRRLIIGTDMESDTDKIGHAFVGLKDENGKILFVQGLYPNTSGILHPLLNTVTKMETGEVGPYLQFIFGSKGRILNDMELDGHFYSKNSLIREFPISGGDANNMLKYIDKKGSRPYYGLAYGLQCASYANGCAKAAGINLNAIPSYGLNYFLSPRNITNAIKK